MALSPAILFDSQFSVENPLCIGIIGNSGQVRNYYFPYILEQKCSVPLRLSWVTGCRCTPAEKVKCPFDCQIKSVAATGLKKSPCVPEAGNVEEWQKHLEDKSVHAVLVSLPNHLHFHPVQEFLKRGIPVAVDKPPVTKWKDACDLVTLADTKNIPFVTLSQRRFERVYQEMDQKIQSGRLGSIHLVSVLFAHGWTPKEGDWRASKEMSGGGVLIDSVFHCIDVVLWLLRNQPKCTVSDVSAQWDLANPTNADSVELRIVVGVKLDNGCLLSFTGSSTSIASECVDEDIKIFGDLGILRYRREGFRGKQGSGSLSFHSRQDPSAPKVLVEEGQGTGLRDAPFADFLECVAHPGRKPASPAEDSLKVLEIIEKAYNSAAKNLTLPPRNESDIDRPHSRPVFGF